MHYYYYSKQLYQSEHCEIAYSIMQAQYNMHFYLKKKNLIYFPPFFAKIFVTLYITKIGSFWISHLAIAHLV